MNSLDQDYFNKTADNSGFTIIEMIIVLAIAALIMLIIFLAVPQLQRSSRNHDRKVAVESLMPALQEYVNNVGSLPMTPAEGTNFINSYVTGVATLYTVQFRGIGSAHNYIPALDTIEIQYGHWCNKYGDGDLATDPIAGTDEDTHAYAIWTRLEPDVNSSTTNSSSLPGQSIICVDDHR